MLGATVVLTFGMLWWPFVMYGPPDTSVSERFLHVLHRIFPFQRGLFEGKVSNLWCALSVRPFSIRERLPEHIQPLLALVVTLILIIPACYKLFRVGQGNTGSADDQRLLLWGMASTGLAFFLASFQVHEKSMSDGIGTHFFTLLEGCCLLSVVFLHEYLDIVAIDSSRSIASCLRLYPRHVCILVLAVFRRA